MDTTDERAQDGVSGSKSKRERIEQFCRRGRASRTKPPLNQHAQPFVWTKTASEVLAKATPITTSEAEH